MLVVLSLLLACGPDAPPTEAKSQKGMVVVAGDGQDKVVAADGTSAKTEHLENVGDFDKFAFSCCATQSATTMVNEYVDVMEQLAADNAAGTRGALAALMLASRAASEDKGLSEEARAEAAAISAGVGGLTGRDLAGVRDALASLSVSVITFARANQGEGDKRFTSAWCPMAPGHWLQRDGAIKNPYYGAEMLTCGTLEAVAEVE